MIRIIITSYTFTHAYEATYRKDKTTLSIALSCTALHLSRVVQTNATLSDVI